MKLLLRNSPYKKELRIENNSPPPNILLKGIKMRIDKLREDEFGFRKGKGTSDTVVCLRMIGESLLEK